MEDISCFAKTYVRSRGAVNSIWPSGDTPIEGLRRIFSACFDEGASGPVRVVRCVAPEDVGYVVEAVRKIIKGEE